MSFDLQVYLFSLNKNGVLMPIFLFNWEEWCIS
jgi:hypothetical protein